MSTTTYNFTAFSIFEVGGRACYSVSNPVECRDFKHLIGQEVSINEIIFKVINVECFAHHPPWREGERIGLLVEAVA